MVAVDVAEAQRILPALLDRVEAGEEIAISRDGRVVAALVNPDALRTRQGRVATMWEQAARIREWMDAGRDEPIPDEGMSVEYAEELVREIRDGRDAR